jgi:hypothetical protein
MPQKPIIRWKSKQRQTRRLAKWRAKQAPVAVDPKATGTAAA